jgi:hypothetical protein
MSCARDHLPHPTLPGERGRAARSEPADAPAGSETVVEAGAGDGTRQVAGDGSGPGVVELATRLQPRWFRATGSSWRLLIATRRWMWRGRNRMWCRRSGRMRRRIRSRGLRRWRGRHRLGFGRRGRSNRMRCRWSGRMQRRIGSCRLGRRCGRNRLSFGIRRFGLGSAARGVLLAGRLGFSQRPGVGRICTRRRGARLCFSRRYDTFAGELAGLGRRRNKCDNRA